MIALRFFAADILAVALFALLARVAHQTPEMPLNFTGWAVTFLPFLCGAVIGWGILVVSQKFADAQRTFPGVIVWLSTAITGLVLWGLRNGAVPHWSFVLVASVMSGLLLLGWRLVASWASGKKNS